MKRFITTLLVFVLLLSGCAKSDPIDVQNEQENENVSSSDGLSVLPAPDQVLIPKQDGITDAQREIFFELAQEYQLAAMPQFSSDQKPTAEDCERYAVNYCRSELYQKDGNTYIPRSAMERLGKELFNTAFDLSNDIKTTLYPVFMDLPELTYYSEEQKNGKTLITAKFVCHYFSELSNTEDPETVSATYFPDQTYPSNSLLAYKIAQEENLSFYEAAKKAVVSGQINTITKTSSHYEIQYYTEDGTTPCEFVSFNTYILE